jgi:hypothetical protein
MGEEREVRLEIAGGKLACRRLFLMGHISVLPSSFCWFRIKQSLVYCTAIVWVRCACIAEDHFAECWYQRWDWGRDMRVRVPREKREENLES